MRRALVLIAFSGIADASPTPTKDAPAPATLENTPALDGFRKALAAQQGGTAEHPLRIAYFGDSLTADDQITNELRQKLQSLVGDGGAGFVFAAPPHPYCQHRAVSRVLSEGWDIRGISTTGVADHLLGLGGSAETSDGGSVRLVPHGAAKTIDVHFLAQPHGGTLDVTCDGKVVDSISTAADRKRASFETATIPDGTKRIELRTRGRVRLFGEAIEAQRGAVVDNLGIVNATAKQMRTHNMDEHWKNQLAHRAADLVVVMYGTNEAGWLVPNSHGMVEHEKLFGELLATIRAANPDGSCLVVSPLDQIDYRDEKQPPRASIPALVEAQRRAAVAQGCAFWDVYTWMGGGGSSKTWFKHGLLMKDFAHPTTPGATRIADALYDALVAP